MIVYTALFVRDIPGLIKFFPPKHAQVYAHHSTIAFKPSSLQEIEVGKVSKLKIIGRVWDDKGDALLVENIKSQNKYPHITLSCAPDIKPFYSNELIERAFSAGEIEYFNQQIEIDVVEGYFDGKSDIIKS